MRQKCRTKRKINWIPGCLSTSVQLCKIQWHGLQADMERKGKRGKVHGWESEQAGLGPGEKVFQCVQGRKEGRKWCNTAKNADSLSDSTETALCERARARGMTGGEAPGTDHSQMTSHRRGNRDAGPGGTRHRCRPVPRMGAQPWLHLRRTHKGYKWR